MWVIRDGVGHPQARAMPAMPPKAEIIQKMSGSATNVIQAPKNWSLGSCATNSAMMRVDHDQAHARPKSRGAASSPCVHGAAPPLRGLLEDMARAPCRSSSRPASTRSISASSSSPTMRSASPPHRSASSSTSSAACSHQHGGYHQGRLVLMIAQLIELFLMILFPALVTVPAKWSAADMLPQSATLHRHYPIKGNPCAS